LSDVELTLATADQVASPISLRLFRRSMGVVQVTDEIIVNENPVTVVIDIDAVAHSMVVEGLSGSNPRAVAFTYDGRTFTVPDLKAGAQATIEYIPKRTSRVRGGASRVRSAISQRAAPIRESRPGQFVADHKLIVSIATAVIAAVGVLASTGRLGRRKRWYEYR